MGGWRERSGVGVAISEAGGFQAEKALRSVHVECHEVVWLRGKNGSTANCCRKLWDK